MGHVPTLLRQLADKLGLAIISRMRRQAEAALLQREALMHALAVSASELSHRLQPG